MEKYLLPWLTAVTLLLTSLNLSAQQFTFMTENATFIGDKNSGIVINKIEKDETNGNYGIMRPADYAVDEFKKEYSNEKLNNLLKQVRDSLPMIYEQLNQRWNWIVEGQKSYKGMIEFIQKELENYPSRIDGFIAELENMRNNNVAESNHTAAILRIPFLNHSYEPNNDTINFNEFMDETTRALYNIIDNNEFSNLKKQINELDTLVHKELEAERSIMKSIEDEYQNFIQPYETFLEKFKPIFAGLTTPSNDSINMMIGDVANMRKYASERIKIFIEKLEMHKSTILESSERMAKNIAEEYYNIEYLTRKTEEEFPIYASSCINDIKSLTDTCWKNIEATDMTWEIPSRIPFGSDSIKIRAIEGKFIFNLYTTEEGGECPRLRLVIPDSIEYIADRAFSGIEATEITLNCPTPPNADEAIFNSWTYANAKLIVPDRSVETYRTTYPWNKFGTILIPSESSISDIIADGITIRIENGYVTIDSQTEVLTRILDIAGQLIYEGYDRHINLPAHGIYIVNAAGKSAKVAI